MYLITQINWWEFKGNYDLHRLERIMYSGTKNLILERMWDKIEIETYRYARSTNKYSV